MYTVCCGMINKLWGLLFASAQRILFRFTIYWQFGCLNTVTEAFSHQNQTVRHIRTAPLNAIETHTYTKEKSRRHQNKTKNNIILHHQAFIYTVIVWSATYVKLNPIVVKRWPSISTLKIKRRLLERYLLTTRPFLCF